MADDTLKRLLVKLGIDTSEWKTAVTEIKRQLNTVNEQAKRDAASMKSVQKEQVDLTKKQIEQQKRLQAEVKTLAAQDQARVVSEKKTQEIIKTQLQQRILETAEAKKQAVEAQANVRLQQGLLSLEKQKLALHQAQTRELQRQMREQQGSGIMGSLGKAVSGIAGGGIFGAVLGGSFLGAGLEQMFSSLTHKVEALGHALLEASGPAQTLREEFERLAKERGVDPTGLLTKLRMATRGLISDIELFKIANNFLKSNIKVTTEQMQLLIQNTMNLGRSMGKTGPQVAKALEMAFINPQRGMMQLARVTGISREVLMQALKGLPAGIDPATRATIMFNHVLAEEEKMLRKVGVAATTLPELMTQIDNAEKNFVDDMATGVLSTGEFGHNINELSQKLIGLQPTLEKVATAFGQVLAEALSKVISFIKDLVYVTKTLSGWSVGISKDIQSVVDVVNKLASVIPQIDLIEKAFSKLSKFNTDNKYFNPAALLVPILNIENVAKLLHTIQQARGVEEPEIKGPTDPPGPAGEFMRKGDENEPNNALAKKLLQERTQLYILYDKMALENTKQRIANENILIKNQYDEGLLNLKDYVEKEKALKQQGLAATIDELRAEGAAKLKELNERGLYTDDKGNKISVMDPKEKSLRTGIIKEQTDLKIEEAKGKEAGEEAALDRQLLSDREAAYRTYIETINELNQRGVKERISVLETEFKQGNVSADVYIKTRKDLIDEELKLTIDGLEAKKSAAKNNEKEIADIYKAEALAYQSAESDKTKFTLSENEIRLQALKTNYDKQKKILELEAATAKQTPGIGPNQQAYLLDSELLTITDRFIAQQREMLHNSNLSVIDQLKIKESIAQAAQEQQKLNLELAKSKDLSAPLSSLFGELSGLLKNFKNTSGITALLSSMSSASGLLSKFSTGMSASRAASRINSPDESASDELKAPMKDLGSSFTNLFKTVKNSDGAVSSFASKLQDFIANLSTWIAGISGLVQGVTSGKSTAGGVMSGGMAGMQFGSNFGPLGSVVGGIGGAIFGGIFGHKQEELRKDLKTIQDQMQSIISSMNAGTISMAQTIADLRKERESAIKMLSGNKKAGKSKKGSASQLQSTIAGIDAEIAKLVDEQTQILQSLTSSLITISQPIQYQEYMNSLDQIIQKYQEFASAAQGNSEEMAKANQYLNLSLQNYITTLNQNLNQAQQTAIQDALTLINLEYQRQQLINQEAQQEYDILTQGVLTRQRTTAMTKGQEIGQLRYQRDMQLEQMDEEIALNQAKVDAETKIFGLATTRIGLEQQLLAAQEEAANYQIAQVLALSQVVGDLTSGMSSGEIMQQLTAMEAGGALPTGSGLLAMLAQLLGLSTSGVDTGGQYGTKNWLAQVPQQWQDVAQFMSQQDPNFYSEFEAAAGTSPGSTQRKTAAADITPTLIDQGGQEGFDMEGFLNWLLTGSIPSLQSMSEGGAVEKTGLIYAHEGEKVIPKNIFSPFINALNSFAGNMFNSGSAIGSKGVSQTGSTQLLSTHSKIFDLTQQRSDLELQVVSARQAQVSMEMDYLSALNDTLSNMHSMIGGGNLEAAFQKVYETRGRYGSGNFRRTTP